MRITLRRGGQGESDLRERITVEDGTKASRRDGDGVGSTEGCNNESYCVRLARTTQNLKTTQPLLEYSLIRIAFALGLTATAFLRLVPWLVLVHTAV